MRRIVYILLMILLVAVFAEAQVNKERRRITPVNTPATTTQSINETREDTARINAKIRERSTSYVDSRGRTIYVDTVTGKEWTDSTTLGNQKVPHMIYPLFQAASIGVNIWDPVMRIFGQNYGIADAFLELSLHNRYKPVFEVGLGTADHEGPNNNYRYRSPLSVYFRIGANYNFLFNSNPDYSFFVGARYGFSPFSYSVDDVILNSPYWGETQKFSIPSQHVTAGWFEFVLGLRVKLWGPISAGWSFKFHKKLHESAAKYGEPWYIPGFGSRNSSISGSFSVVYTISLEHLNKPKEEAVIDTEVSDIPTSEKDITPDL